VREIDAPVDLCRPDGRLNPAAVGFSRRPLHRANLGRRGRRKRWEYWCVQTPDLVFSVTVSDLDYATLCSAWSLGPDRIETAVTRLDPLRSLVMPERCGGGPVHVESGPLSVHLVPTGDGTRLTVAGPDLSADLLVEQPAGHEALGVVVPWSTRLFQYTVKQNTLPVTGSVTARGHTHEVSGPDAWATLDHGRGRWPYSVLWNWGAGSGRVQVDDEQRVLGLQLGGAWTDGTGSVENALTVDGVLHVVHDELAWAYDTRDWLAPWRITSRTSNRVDLTFHPFHDRADRTQLGVLFNDTHQCFGTWSGTVVDDDGRQIHVSDLYGWAEQVRNRW
jgi:hypothetical protein